MSQLIRGLSEALADRYRIEREIGQGGMATVYLAEDLRHHRPVAIKVLAPELAAAVGPQRFLREIETAARLSHPHIVPLHDSGEAGGLLFYVMPFVEGESLRQRLDRERQLPVDEACRIAREVADALALAHRQGIVHRDIKPENILLSGGHALVADFGIARAVASCRVPLTGTGVMVGTATYASPEQASGTDALDGRSDLYSLGCVLFEMLGGQPPFTGPTTETLIHQHLSVVPPPVTNLRPTVPPSLTRLVARMLEKSPADRFASAERLVEALDALSGPSPAPVPAPAAARARRLVVTVGAVLATGVLAALLALGLAALRRKSSRTEIPSVAVLPLANLSGDTSQEYFADGMTDELITELSKIGGLRVAARTSVMRFRGTTMPVAAIARELRVGAVVEGAVARVGERVRVTATLIDPSADRPLWAERYEREMGEVLALQAEVAQAIARSVHVRLSPREQARLSRGRSVDPRAYEACLRGRYLLDRMTFENFRGALDAFEQAIEIDPAYAEAWAGLALAYYSLSSVYVPAREAMPKVRAAAQRALQIDPELGAAHAAMGVVLAYFEWRWGEAEASFRRAMSLDPSNVPVLWYYGTMLEVLGRFDESLAIWRRALELDPLSSFTAAGAAYSLLVSGQSDQAMESYQALIARDSSYAVAHYSIALCHVSRGEYDAAIKYARRAVELGDNSDYGLAVQGYAYAMAGKREQALEVLRRLPPSAQGSYSAKIYAALGMMDRAFAALEKSFENRDEDIVLLKADPSYAPLRTDPRYALFLERLNLPR